mgnify:CR=1 FL=1
MSVLPTMSTGKRKKLARWTDFSNHDERNPYSFRTRAPAIASSLLNRPDKLNAFNEAMHQALREAIEDAEADESCRALLITGAGRGFALGQDLSDRFAKPGENVVLGGCCEAHYNPLVRKLRALPFLSSPASTARSRRWMQHCARLRYRHCQPEGDVYPILRARRLGAGSGGTWFLPRLVGDARARRPALFRPGPDRRRRRSKLGSDLARVEDEVLMHEATRICEHFALAHDGKVWR